MSFDATLGDAIARSELSLTEVRRQLRERGIRISVSTLSGWRTGLTVPSTSSRRVVLPALEEILGLPSGTLEVSDRDDNRITADRLVQPGVRATWAGTRTASALLAQIEARPDDENVPQLRSLRFRMHVNEHGHNVGYHASALVRATRAPAHRLVRLIRFEQMFAPPPITVLQGGTLGRVVTDLRAGIAAFEILLPEPVQPGQSTLVEHHVASPPQLETQWFRFRVPPRMRELTFQIGFTPERQPTEVRLTREVGSGPATGQRITGLDGQFQVSLLRPPAGGYGLEWTWQ